MTLQNLLECTSPDPECPLLVAIGGKADVTWKSQFGSDCPNCDSRARLLKDDLYATVAPAPLPLC